MNKEKVSGGPEDRESEGARREKKIFEAVMVENFQI